MYNRGYNQYKSTGDGSKNSNPTNYDQNQSSQQPPQSYYDYGQQPQPYFDPNQPPPQGNQNQPEYNYSQPQYGENYGYTPQNSQSEKLNESYNYQQPPPQNNYVEMENYFQSSPPQQTQNGSFQETNYYNTQPQQNQSGMYQQFQMDNNYGQKNSIKIMMDYPKMDDFDDSPAPPDLERKQPENPATSTTAISLSESEYASPTFLDKDESENMKKIMEEQVADRERIKLVTSEQVRQQPQSVGKKKIEGGFIDGPIKCPVPLEDIAREFMELEHKWAPVKKSTKHFSIAKDVKNIAKNRYPDNIWPYNHNVVTLTKKGEYINASQCKINDFEYLVTQWPCYFPTEGINTIPDFWDMVWLHNCTCVVNLQKLDRKDHETYFPVKMGNSETHGEYIVQNKMKRVSRYFDIFMVNIKLKKKKKKVPGRMIQIVVFKVWPDHHVPEDFNSLYDLIKTVNMLNHKKAPFLIHCSAGLGRTGVFMAVHNILHYGQTIDNVMSTVHLLRKNRYGMVQNIKQYQFIYDAIYWVNCKREQHHKTKKL